MLSTLGCICLINALTYVESKSRKECACDQTGKLIVRPCCTRCLTAAWSDRRVLHVEIDISGSGMHYKPGDSLGVVPANDPAVVDGILTALNVDGNRVFSVAPKAKDNNQGTGGTAWKACGSWFYPNPI